MKITTVEIKNLFGTFNHKVPINLDERITIIHGPNGYGKTILLKLLYGVFNAQYSELKTVPFDYLQINFSDGSKLRITKTATKSDKMKPREKNRAKILFVFSKPNVGEQTISLEELERGRDQRFQFPTAILEEFIPGLEQIDLFSWRYIPTQEMLTLEQILERFNEYLPSELYSPNLRTKSGNNPEWLQKLTSSIKIYLISTERLLKQASIQRSREAPKRFSTVQSVIDYSEELAKTIKSKLAESAELSQSLDRTFPARLVKHVKSDVTDLELRNKLNELEKKRSRLMAAGLLDKEEDINFQVPQQIDEHTKNVLAVYVEDVKQKLGIFDEILSKIDLLKKIINEKFSYKQITINKGEGFVFKTLDKKDLSPINLSSGEQHELVLLYEMLFKVKPNSLILIDEPEISLHVVWQTQFLKDLREITQLSNFDVVIATHSPQIIDNNWNLTVELRGPLNETIHNA